MPRGPPRQQGPAGEDLDVAGLVGDLDGKQLASPRGSGDGSGRGSGPAPRGRPARSRSGRSSPGRRPPRPPRGARTGASQSTAVAGSHWPRRGLGVEAGAIVAPHRGVGGRGRAGQRPDRRPRPVRPERPGPTTAAGGPPTARRRVARPPVRRPAGGLGGRPFTSRPRSVVPGAGPRWPGPGCGPETLARCRRRWASRPARPSWPPTARPRAPTIEQVSARSVDRVGSRSIVGSGDPPLGVVEAGSGRRPARGAA